VVEKPAEVQRRRGGYLDLAADGIMNRDELRAKLAALGEVRQTAERELAGPGLDALFLAS
jgi:hypothetical protein